MCVSSAARSAAVRLPGAERQLVPEPGKGGGRCFPESPRPRLAWLSHGASRGSSPGRVPLGAEEPLGGQREGGGLGGRRGAQGRLAECWPGFARGPSSSSGAASPAWVLRRRWALRSRSPAPCSSWQPWVAARRLRRGRSSRPAQGMFMRLRLGTVRVPQRRGRADGADQGPVPPSGCGDGPRAERGGSGMGSNQPQAPA